jgi:hypothetical protein
MWAQFATTFRFSLRTMITRPIPAALFGAAGGPIAFLAGERLGAVARHHQTVLDHGFAKPDLVTMRQRYSTVQWRRAPPRFMTAAKVLERCLQAPDDDARVVS